jgi:hypothetical protein
VKTKWIVAAALVAAAACRSPVEETARAPHGAPQHGKDRAAITAEIESRHGLDESGAPDRWLANVTWSVSSVGDRRLLLAKATELTLGNAPRVAFYGWLGDGAEPSMWQDAFAFETATDGVGELHTSIDAGRFVVTVIGNGAALRRLFTKDLSAQAKR